jgi:hypothetical protein
MIITQKQDIYEIKSVIRGAPVKYGHPIITLFIYRFKSLKL